MATTPSRSRRTPGRPPKARIDQRARLLDVAIGLFAQQGIAATPLSAIARRARVTPALLHYYFGNREQLLDALVEERLLPLLAPLHRDLSTLADAPRSQIDAFVRDLLQLLADNPWLPPLWLREVLGEGGLLRDRLMRRVAQPVSAKVRDAITRAQARGAINRDLDPRLLVVSLIGLTMFPLAARSIWSRVFDAEDIGPAEFARHTIALLERGLEIRDD
ncbi:TetR/AcrR family transcriptional regulator [Dokdonella sp.]|uniref:TetR/AcrR family transcriptional regulator n=1 Tax=Dokdonella sp. TaxID=2291710 RepID=UPI0026357813|nr:TetR/AcrR family transcriptional regulator [Dokdonella sp.]